MNPINDSLTRVSFQKIVMVAVAPIVVVIICIMTWHLIFKIDSCLERRKRGGTVKDPNSPED